MRNPSNVHEFVGVGEIAETTIQLLSFNLNSDWSKSRSSNSGKAGLEEVEQLVFQQARDYLSNVREGFVLSVRSADIPDRYQLRYLLDKVLFDWEALSDELGLDSGPEPTHESSLPTSDAGHKHGAATSLPHSPDNQPVDATLEPVRQQLLAFGMAAVAMGALPKLPSDQVTFPRSYGNPPTYADISAPSSPAEMLVRIEELEEMIWQLMAGDADKLVQSKYGSVRRTYGFFESSAWLVRNDAECFGIKKGKSAGLTYF